MKDNTVIVFVMLISVFASVPFLLFEYNKEMKQMDMVEKERQWERDSTLKAMELQEQYRLDSLKLVIKEKLDKIKSSK